MMSLFLENESKLQLSLSYEDIANQVMEETLNYEKCPYEVEVNLLLTDNETIRKINLDQRQIDRPTDVLSFPMVEFTNPSDFSEVEEHISQYFHPETGELILGDIVISLEKVVEQAEGYGHSKKREYAFLIAHSLLHLLGYDHMNPEEAQVMEKKQRQILKRIQIFR